MSKTLDLGRRIELLPMDPQCGDISIALYERPGTHGATFLVHSYAQGEAARKRVHFITHAMQVLGGLEFAHGEPGELHFNCGAEHLKAARRMFLDACKLPSDAELTPHPLCIEDKKSGKTIRATYTGNGAYRLSADDPETQTARVPVYVNGLVKLGELESSPAQPDVVCFGCHAAHDPLVGQLMIRAQNVRAILREQEQMASRGVLTAPSAQQEA